MRIAIATVQVPFISGGAELHTQNLRNALESAGHQVDIITMPFWFSPNSLLKKYEERWIDENLSVYLSGSIDKVICLKYPSYHLKHPRKSLWLLHPLSSYYDFYNTPFGASDLNFEENQFRKGLIERDTEAFSSFKNRYSVSKYLSRKINEISGVPFTPLYHPPPEPNIYRIEGFHPFIFAPSRLEEQKRHSLIIKAMELVDPALHLVVAGDGGQEATLKQLARDCGVDHRVLFLGDIDRKTMAAYYANCFAVYFGPFSEPYGYITLEAMLSSKPVITCNDSGCPTEFVRSEETGMITHPDPMQISEAINTLWSSGARPKQMGRAGKELYESLRLDWQTVAKTLVD